jgi:hypothetical protein
MSGNGRHHFELTLSKLVRMGAVSNTESGTPSVNNRSVEAVDALGAPIPMRQAAVELIDSHDYDKAAKRAGRRPKSCAGGRRVRASLRRS